MAAAAVGSAFGAAAPLHPYYPLDLHLPGWQPLAMPFDKILTVFFTACGVVVGLGWWLTGACAGPCVPHGSPPPLKHHLVLLLQAKPSS
jgi:hypothetical protein